MIASCPPLMPSRQLVDFLSVVTFRVTVEATAGALHLDASATSHLIIYLCILRFFCFCMFISDDDIKTHKHAIVQNTKILNMLNLKAVQQCLQMPSIYNV